MAYRIVLTTSKVANAKTVEPEDALADAHAEWESGKWLSVRLLTEEGTLYWKRGATGDSDAEARDRANLSSAAGLHHLILANDEIGGLADLECLLADHVSSFEVHAGSADLDGLLECDGDPPRLGDLLTYLDTRLSAPASLTGWRPQKAPGLNPAHGCLHVELGEPCVPV